MANNTQYDDELFDDFDDFDDYEELDGGSGFEEDRGRETVRGTGFRVAAVLMFLFSVLGLFLGLISKWVSFLTPVTTAGTDGALNNSLIGVLLEIFKGLFTEGGIRPVTNVSLTEGLLPLLSAVHYYFYFVVTLCIVLSLVLAIVSLTPERVKEGKRRPSRAERCAFGIALLNAICYGGLFFIQLFMMSALGNYVTPMNLKQTVDFPSLIIGAIAAVFLLLVALSGAKRRDEKMGNIVVNFILYLFSLVTLFALAHPAARTIADLDLALTQDGGLSLGIRIAVIALTALMLFNVLASLFRIRATRGSIFDCVRYAFQLIAIIVVYSLYIAIPKTGDGPDFGILVTLPALVGIIFSLTAFLLALFVMIHSIKNGAPAAEETAKVEISRVNDPLVMSPIAPAPVGAPAAAPQNTDDVTPTNISIIVDRPAQSESETQDTVDTAEEEPEETKHEPFTVSETVMEHIPEESDSESEKIVKSIVFVTNDAEEESAPKQESDLPYDVNETPMPFTDDLRFDRKEEEPVREVRKVTLEPEEDELGYEPVRDVPKTERIREIYYYKDEKDDAEDIIEKKAERQEEKKEEPPVEPAKPEPIKTDFMREMEELARSAKQPEKKEEPQAPTYDNRYAQPTPPPAYQPPQPQQQPMPQRAPAPAPAPYAYYPQPNQPATYIDAQYTYDPFFITLTPQERNEFGDLFISNKFGAHAYLPLYVIGGENKEFFEKIFIYLGRYRGNISAELLDKIYVYVSAKH